MTWLLILWKFTEDGGGGEDTKSLINEILYGYNGYGFTHMHHTRENITQTIYTALLDSFHLSLERKKKQNYKNRKISYH